MSETAIVQWLAVHPFTHAVLVAAAGAIAASIRHDRAAFEVARAADPTAEFRWLVALKHYAIGGGMAAATIIGAKLLYLLGVA